MQRLELGSVEFEPIYQAEFRQDASSLITLERRLAPTPGVNFTFGLGVGVAFVVESKHDAPVTIARESGDAYLRVHQVEIGFEGWKLG